MIVWDRGWPTAFVSTTCAEAHELFRPFPSRTILLLNTEKTILEKVQKHRLKSTWLTDFATRKKYVEAYQALAEDPQDNLLVFRADETGRFDFEQIFCRVVVRGEAKIERKTTGALENINYRE